MDGYKHIRIRRKIWFYRIMGTLLTVSIPLLRKASGQGSSTIHTASGIQRQSFTANDVPCEWLIPTSASKSTAMLYLHGGGGVVGLLVSERMMVIAWLLKILSRLALMIAWQPTGG
jgi:hypothetical protein